MSECSLIAPALIVRVKIASRLGMPVLGKMPIDPSVVELCDKGDIEKLNHSYLDSAVEYIEKATQDAWASS